jgi:maltose O-acetyltransferase
MNLGHKLLSWMEASRVRRYISLMKVGRRVAIKRGLRVKNPGNVTIGNDVRINNDLTLQAHGAITIGDETMISACVKIVTANHDITRTGLDAMKSTMPKPVVIGKGCWLGANVLVLPGVTIGDGAVVGGGSVVVHDLPPNTVCVGVPAKPVKARPGSCGESK